MITGTSLAASVNLDSPGRYLHWSIFTVSEANLVLIAVMVVIFGAALVIPFPGHGRVPESPPGEGSAEDDAGLLGLRLRGSHPGRPGRGDRVRLRHRPRGHRLVAHRPGGAFFQQPPSVECRGLHGLHGHPLVGQVLDGRLAG